MKSEKFSILLSALLFSFWLTAQPSKKLVEVIVSPDKTDWTYNIGERAEFSINVLRNNVPLQGVDINYTIEPDPGYRDIKTWAEGTLSLNKSSKVKATNFNQPGFLRCTATGEVDGKEYSSYTITRFCP